jgi:Protein of unknown function (DUF3605)
MLTNASAAKNLSILRRTPSDLANYIAFYTHTIVRYIAISNYICQERLRWQPLPSPGGFAFQSAIPFANSVDYKILRNDWPYGLTKDISHLVVWSKTPTTVTEDLDDPTPESQRLIEDFVERTFTSKIPSGSRI